MKSINTRMLAMALVMLFGAGLAWALTPRDRLADTRATLDLTKMIPETFGDWAIDHSMVPIEPSPDVQAKLAKIYSQTLSRTYINRRGERIMLSIAYGRDQSDGMQIHKPEVCYASQGFDVSPATGSALTTQYGALPTKRLIARKGDRHEPITYWVVISDQAVASSLERKLVQLAYGLTGKVPDGFLVRVSSINRDAQTAYREQDWFVNSMLPAMAAEERAQIAGRFGG